MATAIAATRDASEMLATRRSPLPDSLVAPGPDAEESARLFEIALRVPDHGRLAPWRLIRIAGESKARWVERLMQIVETREDAAKTRVSTRKLASAPLAQACRSCSIDVGPRRNDRPSDHTPLTAEFTVEV